MRRPKAQATRATQPQDPFYKGFKAPPPLYFAIAACLFVIMAVYFIPDSPDKPEEKELSLNTSQAEDTAVLKKAALSLNISPAASDSEAFLKDPQELPPLNVKVKDGDSMSLVFARAGLGATTVHKLAYESKHGKEFSKILPGKTFQFFFDQDKELQKIIYTVSRLESFEAIPNETGFTTSHTVLKPKLFSTVKSGEIKSSFYLDGLNAGLNDNLIMELANIFGWDIDFALEIRKGDQFSVLFEEKYIDGEYLGTGRILAAEFINRGKSIKAVRYEDTNGKVSFYTPEGLSMRKAFLRTPLDVFRISSHFNLNRKHPILNKIRAHKGTDYAAPRGTPVKAAGDGKVTFAGRNGSYGNMVKISHGQKYETRYAHLKNFGKGIRSGKWVQQGQIIGYVGTTGRSTGPHLHYEFHVNGAVRNPVTVKLPNGNPIARSELDNFQLVTKPLLAKLSVSKETFIAKANPTQANTKTSNDS